MSKAFILVDLGFGDSGKGTMVDYLCTQHEIDLVVRSNGGAQSGHNVVLPDGMHHEFAQFGAGTLQGVRTHLSEHFLVNPHELFYEDQLLENLHYEDPLGEFLSIHRDALVTTRFHVMANQIKEKVRAQNRHGSCGKGIGETMRGYLQGPHFPSIFVRDFSEPSLENKLLSLQYHMATAMEEWLREHGAEDLWLDSDEFTIFTDTDHVEDHAFLYRELVRSASIVDCNPLPSDGNVIFEPSQGMLLDQDYGFQPHTTWSSCGSYNARQILIQHPQYEIESTGVMRTYMTRHGAGPFVTESGDLLDQFPEPHNNTNEFQGGWRVGHIDFVALRWALACAGRIDNLAVTHLDRLQNWSDWLYCDSYHSREEVRDLDPTKINDYVPVYDALIHPTAAKFIELTERKLDKPVKYKSFGPTSKEKGTISDRVNA